MKESIHLNQRSKAEGERNQPTDVDNEVFALQRYLGLLAEGQTVALDMLFAPAPELKTALWEHIVANKERLLTKKSAAFVGYCRTQANKYGIKGSRVAAAREAAEGFALAVEKHGSAAKVGDILGDRPRIISEHSSVVTKETTMGHVETYYVCCDRMVGFKNTLKEAAAIFKRVYEAYGDRARLAENNEGIDWKALSHAVRVGREALELLETHKITFPLPDAAHILEIKQGKLAYQTVAEEIELLLAKVEEASLTSTLRDSPDQAFINDLVFDTYYKKLLGGS